MAKKRFSESVEFGGLSLGDETARLSVKIHRGWLELEDADAILAGSRCEAKIEIAPDGEQGTLKIGGKSIKEVEPLEAVVDVKRFGVSREDFTTGLTFQVSEIDVSKLARFANKAGKLTLKRTGDIPNAVKAEAEALLDGEKADGKEPDEINDGD